MSAVFGVIDFSRPARRSPRKLIQHLSKVHGLDHSRHLEMYADGWFALGYLPPRFQSGEAERKFHQDDRVVVFVEGEILNRASTAAAARIPLEVLRQMSQPQLICTAFEHRGPALFSELDGNYRIVIWDYIKKAVYLSSDRSGYRPLYFAEEQDRVLFATEIKFLLRAMESTPAINMQAINDFLCFGTTLDQQTFFSKITRMPAEHFMHIAEGGSTLFKYTDDGAQEHGKLTDPREAANLLRNAALTSVKAFCDRKQTGILLSGGIDSRLILAAQKRLGIAATAFTASSAQSPDMRLACEVSRRLGIKHVKQELTGREFWDAFRRAVWLSDGQLDGARGMLLSLVPALKQNPVHLLDGMQPLDAPYHSAELKLWKYRKWNLAQQIWLAEKAFGRIYRGNKDEIPAGHLLREDVFGELLPAEIRLQGMVANWNFARISPAAALRALEKNVRQRSINALGLNLLRHYVHVASPLSTFAFQDVVESLPDNWHAQDKILMRRVLCDLNPDLAEIPWQRNMLNLRTPALVERFWLAVKLLMRLTDVSAARPELNSPRLRYPFFDFMDSLRNNDFFRNQVKLFLFDLLPDELINRHAVRQLLYYAVRYNADLVEILTRVMTVNLWYHVFVMGEHPAAELQLAATSEELYLQDHD